MSNQDLFSKGVPSNSQLKEATNTSTQEDPGVFAQTLEIEKIL